MGYQNPVNEYDPGIKDRTYGGFEGHPSQGAPRGSDKDGLRGVSPGGSPKGLTDKGSASVDSGLGSSEAEAALSDIGARLRGKHQITSMENSRSDKGQSIDIPSEGGRNSVNHWAE